jgi:replication factor C small subunit
VGQDEIIERLKSYVRSGKMPHLLFSGPPGVGKTASAIGLARGLYEEMWRYNFTELNASDDRGIDVVRNKIKVFAKIAPVGGFDFKIIFLDEADALTPDAQSALRRTMEIFSNNCRFILSCNYSSKIIEPIQSRCAVYRFKFLSTDALKKVIREIAEGEDIKIRDDAIEALKDVSGGDMRKAINALQSSAAIEREIEKETIYEMAASVRPDEMRKILDSALGGSFDKARDQLSLLIEKGTSSEEIIKVTHRIIFDLDITNDKKVNLIDRLGETEFRITEGADERIQLDALLAYIALIC